MAGRDCGLQVNASQIFLTFQAAFLFLGEAYLEPPDGGWLESLPLQEILSGWPIDENPETREGLGLLKEYLKAPRAFPILRLKLDYTHLFIGPGAVLAAPYESAYLGGDGTFYEKNTLEVRHFYLDFGLELEEKNVRPDDHIGFELQFVSYLCEIARLRLEKQDSTECEKTVASLRKFFRAHLGLWASSFCERVVKHAETDFYRGISLLTIGALRSFQELLGPSDFKKLL